MKKLQFITVLLCAALLCGGCYSVKIQAGGGSDRPALASQGEVLPYKDNKKNWYILWGLVPVGNHSTAGRIQEAGLKTVRVETKMKFGDVLISLILAPLTIGCNTTTIEGATNN
jgi:hypothetical protein